MRRNSSRYTRYTALVSEGNKFYIDYRAMYKYALQQYENVPLYSGMFNNCSNVAANIIVQGSEYYKKYCSITFDTFPNEYFNTMANFTGIVEIGK